MQDERGSVATIAAISLLVVLLLGAVGFGFWAFSGRQDYKNNVDAKISTAVAANTKAVQAADAVKYAEEAKNPLKTYTGPSEYGSIQLQYPKTWSGYVVENTAATPVDGYFHPDVVPAVNGKSSVFALRVEVLRQQYSNVLKQYSSTQQQGKVTVKPYAFTKVPDVVGSRIDGQIAQNKQGSVVIVPLRDKTLRISTESDQFKKDFETIILPNVTFSP